jgi:DNA-binding SARP family transcriptional activator
MTVHVRLFGPIALDDGTQTLGPRDFGGLKPKQLLEQLLCAHGRLVSKDCLAEGLWGEGLPRNVEATLETYVSVLRRSLGAVGRDLVVTEPRAYRLAAELVTVDLGEFDALLDAAAAATATSDARDHLERALALASRGDVLADEPYADWAEPLRRHYHGKILSALVAAAGAALSLDDADAALVHADAALARDGFHEPAHRARILALYILGRQHEALEAYLHCRRILDDELGLEPMPETRALQKAILAQTDPAQLVAVPVPPPPTPTQPAVLVGRRRELDGLECVARAALAGHGALLVLEGEPSIGKTTLLDAFVGRLGGVRIGRARCTSAESSLQYVPLVAAVRDAIGDDERLTAIATGEDAPQLATLEALAALLREQAPLLLVLDDVDRGDDATIAAVAYLNRRCSDVPVVLVAAVDVVGARRLESLEPALRLRLEALTRDELDDDSLHEQTGGHPQLVRAVLDDDPSRVEDLAATLVARCRDAGPFAYRILLTSSILDSPFAAAELADVLGVDELALVEQLEELCELRLLTPVGDSFRFRYPLLREALRRSLTPARRRLLHARISSTVPVRLAS